MIPIRELPERAVVSSMCTSVSALPLSIAACVVWVAHVPACRPRTRKGIGAKTAHKLLVQHRTISTVLAAARDKAVTKQALGLSDRLRKNLLEDAELLLQGWCWRVLVGARRSCPCRQIVHCYVSRWQTASFVVPAPRTGAPTPLLTLQRMACTRRRWLPHFHCGAGQTLITLDCDLDLSAVGLGREPDQLAVRVPSAWTRSLSPPTSLPSAPPRTHTCTRAQCLNVRVWASLLRSWLPAPRVPHFQQHHGKRCSRVAHAQTSCTTGTGRAADQTRGRAPHPEHYQ